MMERIWLGVLYLSGWNISSCLLRQYHYVADPKTWTEAQTYCRKNYTDLATIANTSEMNQLTNTVKSSGYSSEVWIGAYNRINWRWSDGYNGSGDEYRNWYNGQPDSNANEQFCVMTGSHGRWWDYHCMSGYPFVCNNGTRLDPVFVYVNKEMSWFSAQRYCRENFIDLATVRNDTETKTIQNLVPRNYAWIGLFRDSHMWSDGSSVSFNNWALGQNVITSMNVACGLADLQTGKWKTQSCETTLPFVCYSVPSTWSWNISTCLLRQYHYVADSKTWTEAQTYCRKNYTDLATIANTSEMNQLTNTVKSSGNSPEVWIGAYNRINWRWSDGYNGSGAEYKHWENVNDNEPDSYSNEQFCVMAGTNGTWFDYHCTAINAFICSNGIRLDPVFVYVSKRMNWSNAQRYCMENFIDLATVRSDTETETIRNLVPRNYAWIGLFRDSHMWSDGSSFSFSKWALGPYVGEIGITSNVTCGFADLKTGKWETRSCEKRLPFVCYSAPSPPPVMKRVIKLRIKTGQANVDMNDAAVKADILKKLQDKLKKKGVSGVTLKWREQPDGKVFHKEGKHSRKKYRKKREL